MREKDLYPAVEHFLKTKKNCLPEYIGTELSLKRGKTNHRMVIFWMITYALQRRECERVAKIKNQERLRLLKNEEND